MTGALGYDCSLQDYTGSRLTLANEMIFVMPHVQEMK